MVTCPQCTHAFECTEHSPKVGKATQECPLKKGALWAQVQDDGKNGVLGVSISVEGVDAPKQTDKLGYAPFDPLEAKTYDVRLEPLAGELAKRYEPPSTDPKPVTVANGKIASPVFTLVRRAHLTVKVVERGGAGKLFGKAKVTVKRKDGSVPDPAPVTSVVGTGVADLGWVKVGAYTAAIELDAEDAKGFVPAVAQADIDAAARDDMGALDLPVEVVPVNVVTPKVEAEFKVVLVDPDLVKHQASTEAKKHAADATYIELSLAQTQPQDHPYPKAKEIKLKCAPAVVEAFFDEGCTTGEKLAGDLAAGAVLPEAKRQILCEGNPLKVYLRGKTTPEKFKVSVVLADPGDPFVKLGDPPADLEMAAVRLEMKLHHQDTTEIVKLEVDPDKAPPALTGNDDYDPWATSPKVPKPELYHPNLMKQYHESLRDLALPAQKEMTDEEKVKLAASTGALGRVLHVQKDGNNSRAKLVVKKIDPSKWPAGTDTYTVHLICTNTSGSVDIFDVDKEGTAKTQPITIQRSALEAKDLEFWVEGKTATTKAGDVRIDLVIDRPDAPPVKESKRNADWARFTVVEINEVKVDYTQATTEDKAWDDADTDMKFFINLKTPDEDARKVTIGAQLNKEIEGVTVHFMLAPDKDNGKTANWGVDLPKGAAISKTPNVGLTISGGDDAGKFTIVSDTQLHIDDGVLDTSVQDEYAVEVSQSYDDGSSVVVEYTYKAVDGLDTSGGVLVVDLAGRYPDFKLPLWKWDTIAAAVKHRDKAKTDRKKLLHLSAKTNDKGYAKVDLYLSRFGGDKFQPACYIDQDPHLAKYVSGHTDLEKRKPILSAKTIAVWRRIWYQRVVVEAFVWPAFANVTDQYKRVKAEFKQEPDLDVPRTTVDGYSPQAIYPRYMVEVNGGNADALVVGNANKAQFFTGITPDTKKPNLIPILVCDGQWDPDGDSDGWTSATLGAADFPVAAAIGKDVLSPPLQGGDLFVSGTWRARDWDATANSGAGDWVNLRNGDIDAGDLDIDPARTTLQHVQVAMPAGVGATDATTEIVLEDLVVQAGESFLGESFDKKILAVYDPAETQDFQNTIVHEVGHAYQQVVEGTPAGGVAGVPKHPTQFNASDQGNHCRHLVNQCVMFDSGDGGTLNRYCDVCHAYLLVQDMTTIV